MVALSSWPLPSTSPRGWPPAQYCTVLYCTVLQYLTAGVAACYRGYRLYEGEETRRRVRAWVNFYKRYRDILNSDLVHLRRPDMQGLDGFVHVNPLIPIKGPQLEYIHPVTAIEW